MAREWALGSLGDKVKLGCIQALSGSSLRQLAALNLDRKGVFYSDPVFLEKTGDGVMGYWKRGTPATSGMV